MITRTNLDGADLGALRELLCKRETEVAELTERLSERESALAESNHRIFNCLQLAAGFLRIEAKRLKDADAKEALQSALMRVEAIGRFHRIVCAPTNSNAVDGSIYLPNIAREISASTGLTCHVRAEPVTIDGPIALDLAIAINELVINAAKHAYGGRSGQAIEIECLSNGDGQLRVSVSDHGPGVPPDFDPAAAPSLGMTLLRSITEKHGGELQVANDNGARFTIGLPCSASELHTPMSRSYSASGVP